MVSLKVFRTERQFLAFELSFRVTREVINKSRHTVLVVYTNQGMKSFKFLLTAIIYSLITIHRLQLKGGTSRMTHLEKIGNIFQVRRP